LIPGFRRRPRREADGLHLISIPTSAGVQDITNNHTAKTTDVPGRHRHAPGIADWLQRMWGL